MKKFNRAFLVELQSGDGPVVTLPKELRYEFKVNNLERRPGQCRLRIFNANDDTIAKIYEGTMLTLRVGYEGVANTILFRGQVKNYFPFRQGPDHIIEVYAADWEPAYSSDAHIRSFKESDTIKTIVVDIAKQMRAVIQPSTGSGGKKTTVEVIVNPDNVRLGKLDNVMVKGKQIPDGTCRNALNYLSMQYDFIWWIQNGYFHARLLTDKLRGDEKVIEVRPESGLMLTPQITVKGVTVTTILEPKAHIDAVFRPAMVRSTINVANRFYAPLQGFKENKNWYQRIHEVVHTGDTRGNDWKTMMVGMHLSGEEAGV